MHGMPSVDLSKFDNSWYHPGSRLRRTLWYLCVPLFFKTYLPWPIALKVLLLRLFGSKVGSRIVIKPNVNIKYPWMLTIGENAWIGEGVWIDNLADVSIGNNACISQGAYILTGNHNFRSEAFDLIVKPVVIEEGAWLGARSVVCPGVVMNSHSILTVGSILTKSTEPWMVYSGNPAESVKHRSITEYNQA